MQSTSPGLDRYQAIHKALWKAIEGRKDKSGVHQVSEPEFVPVEDGYSDAKLGDDFPVMRHLHEALDIARNHEFAAIADAFSNVRNELPWSQNPRYTKDKGGERLLNGYAYASLSGPEGPITCMSPRGGFYLMGPDVFYPAHNHAPREVYLIMTPGCQWQLDEGDWFDVEPGDLIFHQPWQMHAMRSGALPVLAYAAWLEPGNRKDIGWSKNVA